MWPHGRMNQDKLGSSSFEGWKQAVAHARNRCNVPPEGQVALLKVDVEGFELPVLKGATAVLSRTQRVYFG